MIHYVRLYWMRRKLRGSDGRRLKNGRWAQVKKTSAIAWKPEEMYEFLRNAISLDKKTGV